MYSVVCLSVLLYRASFFRYIHAESPENYQTTFLTEMKQKKNH